MTTKQRYVDSEKCHVRLNTFDRVSRLHFISHLIIYTIYHVIFRLPESHHNGASTMKTAMSFWNLSKCHTITSAWNSIRYATYYILLRVQYTIRWPSSCCILTYIFKIFFRVQFILAWPSWSTYSRVADDGFSVSPNDHPFVASEKSHVRLNTFDRFSLLHFISHLAIHII